MRFIAQQDSDMNTYDKFEAGGDVRGMSGFEELGVEAETITALDALLFPEFTMWDRIRHREGVPTI